MVEIPRAGQDHLVPRAREGGNSCTEGLIAALGDGGLLRCDRPVVSAAPLVGYFGAQFVQAQNGAV